MFSNNRIFPVLLMIEEIKRFVGLCQQNSLVCISVAFSENVRIPLRVNRVNIDNNLARREVYRSWLTSVKIDFAIVARNDC